MSEQNECHYYIVRYFADPIRDEAINIGIMLLSIDDGAENYPVVRFTRDWGRVLCVDPNSDTQMLADLEETLQSILTTSGHELETVVETLSTSLQTTLRLQEKRSLAHFGPSKDGAHRADAFLLELNRLLAIYVEPRQR